MVVSAHIRVSTQNETPWHYQQMKYESLPSNLKHVSSTTGMMESVLLVQDVAMCIAAADAKEVTGPSATPWLQLTERRKA